MRTLILIGLLLLPTVVLAQNPTETDEEESLAKKEGANPVQFKFNNRPSLRIGDSIRVDFKTKWHMDFRQFYPNVTNLPDGGDDTFLLSRARVGLKGKVTSYFDFEIERELRQEIGDAVDPNANSWPEKHPWKDVYVEFRPFSQLRFRVGKFKMPFGIEQNTSVERLDFVYRARVTEFLTPARERGAMLFGKIPKLKRLQYEFGVFRYDGENTDVKDKLTGKSLPSGGRTYAARISGEPLRYVRFLPRTLRHTYFGVAGTGGEMIEGQNSQHGQTISNFTYFDHLFVKGNRRRMGSEVAWSEGPFGLKGEYIHMSEERIGQGIRDNDLPDLQTRGWSVTGNWVFLGKMKTKGSDPQSPFIYPTHGTGAVELAARLDVLTFYGDPTSAKASRSPRSATILANTDRTWTLGMTWYANHFVKIQANAEREWITDIERSAVAGRHRFWTAIVRLQFAM